jgi:hypothetical protein
MQGLFFKQFLRRSLFVKAVFTTLAVVCLILGLISVFAPSHRSVAQAATSVPGDIRGIWQGQGTYYNGQRGFDMLLTITTVNGGIFSGTLQENVYKSTVTVTGSITSSANSALTLTFTDPSTISGGQIQLNCTYTATVSNGHMNGVWHYPGHSSADGTISLSKAAPLTPTPCAVVAGPSGTTQCNLTQTAMNILKDPNIVLATVHVSGVHDNATAQQNIIDTANGKPAARSHYGNAPGGTVVLHQTILLALLKISQSFPIGVSEIAGGSHSPDSFHYQGLAFDINRINTKPVSTAAIAAPVVKTCKDLGASYVAFEAGNHVHCQWQNTVP